MGECVLNSFGEDGFQSCEGFGDRSTFSSADWAEPQQDDTFTDWGGFQHNSGKEDKLSTTPVTETGTFELPENTENNNEVNSWLVFRDCFPVEEAEKDAVIMEIPPLSELLQSKTDTPPHSALISSEVANFWYHLQSGTETPRLSVPKPRLHSHEGLLKTLSLTHPDTSTAAQSNALSDLELNEPEDHPGKLIQTKLMPPSHCRDTPGYLYQVSRQWLSQYSRNLLPYQHKKDPIQ